jgi:acyl-CoA thioester hydrolase
VLPLGKPRGASQLRAELFYPGRVRTGTWLTRLGRTSVGLCQAIIAGDTVAAEAEAVCVLMDGATRRPMPFPEETRRALEVMLRPSAG